MNILGIDPGSLVTGYGIIKKYYHNIEYIHCDILKLSSTISEIDKLNMIFDKTTSIIQEFQPKEISIEKVFYAKNPRSAMLLGQARAVALLACKKKEVSIYEYSAKQVKQSVSGYGNANKEQVSRAIRYFIDCPATIFQDASDALAIAICHTFHSNFQQKIFHYQIQ